MKNEQKRLLLSEIRKTFGSQEIVAKNLKISRQYLGMIECGIRNPTVKLMAKIENYFSVPANKLFPDLFFERKCNKTKQTNKSA